MAETPPDEIPLKRAIGFFSAVMLVLSGIVGAGIFTNPAIVARSLGDPSLQMAAWAAGGLVALLGAFVYAELAARIPATGGDYAYLRDTYGPLPAFLNGWTLLLVVQTGGMAAVTIVLARNLDVLIGGGLDPRLLVVAILVLLAGVNVVGVVAGNETQTVLGVLKIVVIVAVVTAGFLAHPHFDAATAKALAARPTPLKSFGAAVIPVVFCYGGWQTANFVAGETRDARRTLSGALVVGVVMVIVIYMLVALACVHGLGSHALGKTLTPVADLLQLAVGPLGARLAAAAVAISAAGYMSQAMLTAPRVYLAMARDGLFFRKVGEVSRGGRAPVLAIILQAIWTGALALSGEYEQILSYTVGMNYLFFALAASCLFVLRARERRPGAVASPAGFRAPGHPWTTAAFILACLIVMASTFWTAPIASLIGYGLMGLGLPPYLYWRSRRGPAAALA
ncbi:MAG TPA: amino acid permease [Caulobacteraceae bacterium]|jgi:APA family basic amino acid/polyamine antiporter|nr:amino acid permease [Caulobacteraceae bacterium]